MWVKRVWLACQQGEGVVVVWVVVEGIGRVKASRVSESWVEQKCG